MLIFLSWGTGWLLSINGESFCFFTVSCQGPSPWLSHLSHTFLPHRRVFPCINISNCDGLWMDSYFQSSTFNENKNRQIIGWGRFFQHLLSIIWNSVNDLAILKCVASHSRLFKWCIRELCLIHFLFSISIEWRSSSIDLVLWKVRTDKKNHLSSRNAQTRQLSHPLPVLRAREIDQWSRSQEYRSLLKRATRQEAVQKVW